MTKIYYATSEKRLVCEKCGADLDGEMVADESSDSDFWYCTVCDDFRTGRLIPRGL